MKEKPSMGVLIARLNPALFTIRRGSFVSQMTYWIDGSPVCVASDYAAMHKVLQKMGAKHYSAYYEQLIKLVHGRIDVHTPYASYGAAIVQIHAKPEDMAEAYLRATENWPAEWDEAGVEFEEDKPTIGFLTDAQIKRVQEIAAGYFARDLRMGQSLMNALSEVEKRLYSDITGTDADCFYDDEKIDAFWNRIIEKTLE